MIFDAGTIYGHYGKCYHDGKSLQQTKPERKQSMNANIKITTVDTNTAKGFLLAKFGDRKKDLIVFKTIVAEALSIWSKHYSNVTVGIADCFKNNPAGFENMTVGEIGDTLYFWYNLANGKDFVISATKDESPTVVVNIRNNGWECTTANTLTSDTDTYSVIHGGKQMFYSEVGLRNVVDSSVMVQSFLKTVAAVELWPMERYEEPTAEDTAAPSMTQVLEEAFKGLVETRQQTVEVLRKTHSVLKTMGPAAVGLMNKLDLLIKQKETEVIASKLAVKLNPAESRFILELLEKAAK